MGLWVDVGARGFYQWLEVWGQLAVLVSQAGLTSSLETHSHLFAMSLYSIYGASQAEP